MKKLFSVGMAMVFAASLATVASAGWVAGPVKAEEQAQVAGSAKSARPGMQADPVRKAVTGKGAKKRQITGIVNRITSYNVCYTKLLRCLLRRSQRWHRPDGWQVP